MTVLGKLQNQCQVSAVPPFHLFAVFLSPLAVYRKLSSTLKMVWNGQRCLWLCGGLPSVLVVGASATMRFCTPAEVVPGSIGSCFPVTVPSSAHLSGRIPALSRLTDSRSVPLCGNGGGFPRGSVGLGCPVTAQQRRGTGSRVDSRPCHPAERNPAAASTVRSHSPAPRGAVQASPQTSHPRAGPLRGALCAVSVDAPAGMS